MTYLVIIFWASLFLLAYTYFIFPVLIAFISKIFTFRNKKSSEYLPKISIVIAAYNEEDVIKDKIENALSLNYPKGQLEILVGSDCSSDRTDEILSSYGKKIEFIRLNQRQGKAGVLNSICAMAKGEILVFSDANTMFYKDSALNLTRHFVDPDVGGVCGRLILKGDSEALLGQWEKKYWSFESKLKEWEGRLGYVIGSNGAIYAIRKELYKNIPPNRVLMDDFYETMNVLIEHKKVVYDVEAFATEGTSAYDSGEFTRKVRIAKANFNYLWTQPKIFFLHLKQPRV